MHTPPFERIFHYIDPLSSMTLGNRPVSELGAARRQAKNEVFSPQAQTVRPASIADSGSPPDRPDLLGLEGSSGLLANLRYR